MLANTHVQITKLQALPEAPVETAKWSEYTPGSDDNEKSPPVDYTIKGVLMFDVAVGSAVYALRYERNGKRVPGEWGTSQVTKIDGEKVFTRNSLYLIKELFEPVPE